MGKVIDDISTSLDGFITGANVRAEAGWGGLGEGGEAAHEEAKKAAGNKDIVVQGANIAQQLITLGLIDEILIHLAPVLFGSGTRLFEHQGSRHIPLETVEVIETKEAIHLRFRVVK